MKKWLLTLLLALCLLPGARADEGMWLIQSLDRALEKNMKARGLKLGAREIYNEEAGGLSDAIVSLGFYCTGSMISNDGLLITNHHCAFGQVSELSTPEHNYLEEGFWAQDRSQEIPLKGETFYFLKKVLDVTDEVEALRASLEAQGKPAGSRRLSSILEKKYSEEYTTSACTSRTRTSAWWAYRPYRWPPLAETRTTGNGRSTRPILPCTAYTMTMASPCILPVTFASARRATGRATLLWS